MVTLSITLVLTYHNFWGEWPILRTDSGSVHDYFLLNLSEPKDSHNSNQYLEDKAIKPTSLMSERLIVTLGLIPDLNQLTIQP